MRLKAVSIGLLLPAAAFGVAACGSDDKGGGSGSTVSGKNLTIYSTLPEQGGSEQQTKAIENGAKLAVKQRGGKIGDFTITYKALDDSLASTGAADEGKEAQNARTAVRDKSTIAVLGAYNSGMTKVSLPITNKAGILQVSPSNTYVGLTTDEPGSEANEPGKYYPSGKRTYARVVPKDTIQAAAMVKTMKDDGCTSFANYNSKTTYSAGLGRNLVLEAKKQGIKIVGDKGVDVNAPNYRSLLSGLKADCVSVTMEIESNGIQLLKDAATALPNAKLYGTDAIVLNDTANPKKGLPASVAPRFKGTIATLDPANFPPDGKKFFADYETAYGGGTPDPYAIYGYEAMDLILDSIEAVGAKGGDRQAVIDQVLKNTKGRESVLGTYDIDENGDTTLTDYGLYKIENGKLAFDKVIKAATS
ncbi:MAG: branched-chain amino acid transport system substrate-binding protein [Solirubrobacteraceae bacterium]|nr:branched-chain amino acid transport system substrate-binding protein [Solirubrobacteraceae bacterium]